MEAITRTQLLELESKAHAAGDYALVRLCDRALAGDVDAMAERRRVVDDELTNAGLAWLGVEVTS